MNLVSPVPAGFAVLLLFSAALGAQQPEPGTTFSDTVDVSVAEVEVLVTDRAGKPVSGLTPADFQVVEDGQPVEVTNLSRMSEQPVVIAVFIDDTSLSGAARNVTLRGLKELFASHLKPGDRVLLVRFDGALELHGEPSGDPAVLADTLDRISKMAPAGAMLLHQRSSTRDEILRAPRPEQEQDLSAAETRAVQILDNVRLYIRLRADGTRSAMGALQQTLALLASLPERKAVFYIGGGLPLSPGADLYDLWTEKFAIFAARFGVSPLETMNSDAVRYIRDTADRANMAGVTVHAVALTEIGGVSASAAGAVVGSRSTWDTEDAGQGLRSLTGATGGRVMTDLQNPAPFLQAAGRDIGAAYVIGYAPTPGGKKGRHRLKVTVRGGELNARYREERIDGATGDPLLRRALAALWAGEGANPLKAELTIEEETPEKDGRIKVTAIVALPLAAVYVQPQEHFHVAHLTLAIAARDGKGRMSGAPRAEFPIEIPNERLLSAPGQTAGYRFTLYLAPGESVIAVALRDDGSGAESVARISLTAGSETGAARQ
jgi:VWFA-related protein